MTLLLIDRQERRNALDVDTVTGLSEVFVARHQARPIVLAGAGTTFSSGFDLSTFAHGAAFKAQADRLFDAMLSYPAPIFAALSGPAIGMGAVLAACCDVRIGCGSSWLEIPAARLDVVLGLEYVDRVRQRLGITTAQLLFVASRRVDAERAAQLGALHALHDDPISEAMRWARSTAELSATSRAAHKAAVNGPAVIAPPNDERTVEMNVDEMILVSVDDHVVEPPSMADYMRDHVPVRFRERVPRVITRDDGTQSWLIEGETVSTFGLNASAGRVAIEWGLGESSYDVVRPGCFDVHERIRDMNANGVLASMNFSSWPGISGQYFATRDAEQEYVAAITRAYNDWHIEEWCGAYPGRFIPLGLSGFMLGAEWMAGEIRRLADKGCLAISQHSDTWRWGMPDLHGDEWDPAWAACTETGTVMVYHFGGMPSVGPRANIDVIATVMPAGTAVFAAELIWSPYMRKFPEVKIGLAEAGIGWMPSWLERLDHVYTTNPWRWSANSFGERLPSDVWHGRVLACFIEDCAGLRLRDLIGVDNIAWEADYPHPDTTWPHSPENILAQFEAAGCSDEEINKMSWQNACRFYQFDPFTHIAREQATVGALRARATDVDTTARSLASA